MRGMRVAIRAIGVFVLTMSGLVAAENFPSSQAQQEMDRIRGLVAAGAVSKARLDAAQTGLDDARDEEILAGTLFGRLTAQDLSETQSRSMVDAAERRVARQSVRVNKAEEMVRAGVAARATVEPLAAELELRKKTLELAWNRARLFAEIVEQARAEQQVAPDAPVDDPARVAVRYDGAGTFLMTELKPLSAAFLERFAHPLPVSASGETAVHRSLGYDHRGRVDVALSPDQPEGKWLRSYLESHRIPYFAFRRAVPRKGHGGTHPHRAPEPEAANCRLIYVRPSLIPRLPPPRTDQRR